MKSALLICGTVALAAQAPELLPPIPAATPGGWPMDPKDHQPLLLGPASAKAILEHRAAFRENLAKVQLPAALRARWKAVRRPLTLVAVFGSWCGDSRQYLPDLLALDAESNPFIEVVYLGVYRDKSISPAHWPAGCAPQTVARVPTFYLFAAQPGGAQKRVGLVVEEPPRPKQTMAEALLEMIETARTGD